MPGVFLRYKTFGPWTKEPSFLKSLCDEKNVFVFVSDYCGEIKCSMANNIGLLSNGDIISCCLDYEGEMQYGNIDDMNLWDDELLKQREKDRENVSSYALCRRCKGNIIFADKTPILGDRQEITFFANDWFPFEKDSFDGKGGRWSKCSSTSFVYARLDAKELNIDLLSINSYEPIYIKIYSYDSDRGKFLEEYTYSCVLESGEKKVVVSFDFVMGTFYKIEIHSSTFQPCHTDKNSQDNRNLGVFLFDMSITR